MDLERKIVRGILNAGADHRGVVRARPGPGPVPIAAWNENFLRRPGIADRGNGGIGRAEPCARRLLIRLVHQPEDDSGIGREMLGKLAPEIRKRRIGGLRAADQRAEALAVVVRVDVDLEALARRVGHDVIEAAELGGIERAKFTVLETFPQERQPDHAQAFAGVVIDLGVRGIGVVGAERTRHVGTELGARKIDSEKERAGHGVSPQPPPRMSSGASTRQRRSLYIERSAI